VSYGRGRRTAVRRQRRGSKTRYLNPGKIPYIIIIIDELADLMQTVSADVESAIARITQMGRRGGGDLIVATP
jgi:DNA segregation ATPase FtsK/SpoIIIE-like protein